MTKRPRGITLLIIYYSILVILTGFVTLSTEIAGDLVEERFGDKLKLFGVFDYDKKLAIILTSFEAMILLTMVIILLKPFSLGRFAIIGYEGFFAVWAVVGFFLPKSFFPEEHPYYQFHISGWGEFIGLVFSILIITYLLRPKIKKYFDSKTIEKASHNP